MSFDFSSFFDMTPRIIPIGQLKTIKKKGFQKGVKLQKISKNPYYMDESAFDFIGMAMGNGKKNGRGKSSGMMDIGLDLSGFGSLDFTDFLPKGAKGSTDFLSYVRGDSPKAFETYGKEPKGDTKKRTVGKDYQELYGLESVGISLEHIEPNIVRAGRGTSKRASKAGKQLKEDIGILRHPEEGSIRDRISKRLQKRKVRRELRNLADTSESGSLKTIGARELAENPDIEIRDISGSRFSREVRDKYK